MFVIIPAILFCHFALKRIKRFPERFKGRVTARLGLALCYLALPIIVFVLPAYFHARDYSRLVACTSQMKQVVLAARIWENENGGELPASWIPSTWLSRYDDQDLLRHHLVCPADENRAPAESWDRFTTNNVSYGFVSTVPLKVWAATVYLRCPIHGHEAMTDGTIHWGSLNSAGAGEP